MLDYMYKANYKEEPVGPVQRVQSTQEGWPASSTIANTMLYHVRVNGIADYYDVTGLATLSVTRLSVLLQQYWSERGFCELVQEAGTLTGDKNLRQLLIKTAASHAPELLHGGWFSEGRIANDMAAEVLKALSGHVEHLRSRIVRAETKNNSLENLLRELIDVWHVRNILDA
ncbi:hypothetical protein F4823DRAFT_575670 [Ustulina deusta]|nr:hypothetical protein F4823DRAFT_575670 [Ustulina deusta]